MHTIMVFRSRAGSGRVRSRGPGGRGRWPVGAGCGAGAGLAELPDGAVGGIGDLDAELVELSADLVGPGPVALLAGLGAVGDELGDGALLLGGQVVHGTAALQV